MSGFLLFAALSLSRAQTHTHTYTLSVGVHFPVACCIDDCTALLFDFTVSLSLFLSGGSFEKSKKKNGDVSSRASLALLCVHCRYRVPLCVMYNHHRSYRMLAAAVAVFFEG